MVWDVETVSKNEEQKKRSGVLRASASASTSPNKLAIRRHR